MYDVFFFKQKTAYEILSGLVGSEMCIRDRYLIATVLRGSTHATRWQRVACRVLMEYGPKQFYDDGFCVEQAMGYHYFTSGFLLLAQMAASHVGDTSLQLEELLRCALRAGLPFRQPDGNWPMIGDVDSAQSIPVARENYWDFSATHELAAAAFNDPAVACNVSCLLYTSPSPRDQRGSRMPSSA